VDSRQQITLKQFELIVYSLKELDLLLAELACLSLVTYFGIVERVITKARVGAPPLVVVFGRPKKIDQGFLPAVAGKTTLLLKLKSSLLEIPKRR